MTMWLDAFKPKARDMQKSGVSGVSGVSHGTKPIGIRAGGYSTPLTPGKVAGVSGVSQREKMPSADTTDTDGHHDKIRCQSMASGFKPSNYAGFDGALTPLTPLTPQKHYEPENSELAGSLCQFRFDLVQSDIDAGYPADDLHRVNNIAWRLMTTRGYLFDEAIKAAALWVSDNPPHADEAAFIDVMALFKEIRL
jgi:hypothetical protein